MTEDIPISAAKRIADEHGYDQVVIVARKVGDGGREHVTTYGANLAHCGVAARIGDFFKHELMKWPRPQSTQEPVARDLDTALGMLADWCVAVDENGTGWDDWDEHYKDAMYRDGPLRAQLDKAIAEARSRTASRRDITPPPEKQP